MKFVEGVEVFSITGEKVGTVDRVVIDSSTNKISHLVVKKGFLLVTDKVVPIEWVQDANERSVTLKRTEETFEDLPDFEEMHYVPIGGSEPGDTQVDSVYWYPPISIWWGANMYTNYPVPGYIVRTEQNIPDNTIALEEGAKVYSQDGEHIGDVEQVIAEGENRIATHIVVSAGFFLKERKMVPTLWIDRVEEYEIHLSIHSDTFENIPEYQPTT